MIVLLNTSSSICHLVFIDDDFIKNIDWQADRELAKGLLGYINNELTKIGKNWKDISAIGVFEGPGSFTGLRIGITVMNTIADAYKIPIVGARGEDWQNDAIVRLRSGKTDNIVLPYYGSEANITIAKK